MLLLSLTLLASLSTSGKQAACMITIGGDGNNNNDLYSLYEKYQ
jgi:hypothetical protein